MVPFPRKIHAICRDRAAAMQKTAAAATGRHSYWLCEKYAGKTPSIIIIPNLRRAGKSEITEIVCFLLCSMLVKIYVKTLDVVQY